MELNLAELTNGSVTYDNDFVINADTYKEVGILDLKNLHVTGDISLNSVSMLAVNLTVTGIMVIPDSVTTEPVDYPFTSKIEEEYDINDENFLEYYQKEQNILDIMKILWENIVLEVPMRFTVTKDAHLSGDGWSLGEDKNKDDQIDPRLAKLAELLDNGKE
ncbi:MAG TPA: DUF177 domain-containing protein [Candidatus Caccenecus avistercoris]|nr:DUF177 domain-containing protein [Candidatus Caccenecus avistercoris]